MIQDDISPLPSDHYERRVQAQLARLSKLLDQDRFAAVEELPYLARVGIEKWHHTEKDRVKDWFGGDSTADEKILELSKILNAEKPDRQAGIKWMEENKDQLTIDQLLHLVSDTRLAAVSDWTRQKNAKKHNFTIERWKKIGLRWLQYEAGVIDGIKHSKNSAAPLLAKEFTTPKKKMTEKTMRNTYLCDIEKKTVVFPDGVDAARKKIGLLQ